MPNWKLLAMRLRDDSLAIGSVDPQVEWDTAPSTLRWCKIFFKHSDLSTSLKNQPNIVPRRSSALVSALVERLGVLPATKCKSFKSIVLLSIIQTHMKKKTVYRHP